MSWGAIAMAVRVLVADDEPEIRLLLRLNLAPHQDLEIVAEVGDGVSVARAAAEHRPDVVVLDWMMPGMVGIEAIPLIRKGSPRSRILMYTSRPSPRAEREALAAGADGYLEKGTTMATLVSAIRRLGADGDGRRG